MPAGCLFPAMAHRAGGRTCRPPQCPGRRPLGSSQDAHVGTHLPAEPPAALQGGGVSRGRGLGSPESKPHVPHTASISPWGWQGPAPGWGATWGRRTAFPSRPPAELPALGPPSGTRLLDTPALPPAPHRAPHLHLTQVLRGPPGPAPAPSACPGSPQGNPPSPAKAAPCFPFREQARQAARQTLDT